MTVKELIQHLQCFPDELEARIANISLTDSDSNMPTFEIICVEQACDIGETEQDFVMVEYEDTDFANDDNIII